MLNTYKFRLYPSKDQEVLINKTFGCTRFIYNYYLSLKEKEKENRDIRKGKLAFDCTKNISILISKHEWLKEVDSLALRCTLFDLEEAFTRYDRKQNGKPNYKKKHGQKKSYRTNLITSEYKGRVYTNIKIDLEKNVIILPKLKEVSIRGYRNLDKIDGKIINATISKDNSNRYYVSLVIKEENSFKQAPNTIIGIDLGIKTVVTTSDRKKYNSANVIDKYEKRIKHYQRLLAKKEKGSSNYYKLKEKIAILYRKIKNTRKYHVHEISKEITENNRYIAIEDLNIPEMLHNHHLAKSISDSAWGELIRQIKYKSERRNGKVYEINRFYASSQECNVCGEKNKKVKDLKIRYWECNNCGNKHDRDINAAINIMTEGLKMYVKEIT